MTSVRYAVPSHRRTSTLKSKTLPLLTGQLGIEQSEIDVWVNPDQVEDYLTALAADYGAVKVRAVEPVGRVGAVRNAMARGYPVGTHLIEIDDDVSALSLGWKGAPAKYTPVTAELWQQVVNYAQHVCTALDLGMWGPYPVYNHFFMKANATTDLRYATGTLFGTILRGDDAELVTVDDKEDFERNIRHTMRDGGLLRLNWLAYQTNYYGEPGGMQDYRTPELVDEGALTLAAKYPQFCTYAGHVGKNGNPEVRLTRKGTGVHPPIDAPSWVRAAVQQNARLVTP